MSLVVALLTFLVVLLGGGRLISFYDRKLMLVEYGVRVRCCPDCGKHCFGVRRRAAVGAPWGAWRSECCDALLDVAG